MTSKDVKHLYLTLPIILIINTLFKRFRQMIKEIWLITLKNLFLYSPGQQSAGGILGNVEYRRHVFNHIVGRVIFHDINTALSGVAVQQFFCQRFSRSSAGARLGSSRTHHPSSLFEDIFRQIGTKLLRPLARWGASDSSDNCIGDLLRPYPCHRQRPGGRRWL